MLDRGDEVFGSENHLIGKEGCRDSADALMANVSKKGERHPRKKRVRTKGEHSVKRLVGD